MFQSNSGKQGLFVWALVGFMALQLGACAQSRRSVSSGQAELWEAMDVCALDGNANNARGCFQIQLNITQNLAYVDVIDLGFDPGQTPYRILARRAGDNSWVVLKSGISTDAGGTVDVKAGRGHVIYDYEEWLIELEVSEDSYGISYEAAPAGKGLPIARDFTQWIELEKFE